MSWFPIFGAGFLAGWWMCAITWPRDRPQGEPPLRVQRTVRFDEGRVQRGNRSGAGYQPKPQIDPKGQRRTPNPPPFEP
jgi:hypothetical protein